MKYNFKDISNEQMYNDTRVMLITGSHSVFNNMVSDELKNRCKPKKEIEQDYELLVGFGLIDINKDTGEVVNDYSDNIVDLQTFINVINIPNISGKWFCSTDIKMVSSKQKEFLEKYIKNPSDNGILVILMEDFADYKDYLRDRAIQNSRYSSLIQLNFPNKYSLYSIVNKLFLARGVKISEKAIELFIIRMSSSYDEYDEIIDRVCLGKDGKLITYEELVEDLKGIENFVLDDFIEELLKPMNSDKISPKRSIYKIFGALTNDIGADKLVSKLRYKIKDYIEFRLAINNGHIPIKINYTIEDIKERLPEKSKLKKVSDIQFKRMAYIASLTSLKDWVYMQMLLNNVSAYPSKTELERVLYSLMHRTSFDDLRLDNDIGISNIIEEESKLINNVVYERG